MSKLIYKTPHLVHPPGRGIAAHVSDDCMKFLLIRDGVGVLIVSRTCFVGTCMREVSSIGSSSRGSDLLRMAMRRAVAENILKVGNESIG